MFTKFHIHLTHFTAFQITPLFPKIFEKYAHKKSEELLVYLALLGVWRNLDSQNNTKSPRLTREHFIHILSSHISRQTFREKE